MVEVLEIIQIDKYQVIKVREFPNYPSNKIKLIEKIYDIIPIMDAACCIAIDSQEDHSDIKALEFIPV